MIAVKKPERAFNHILSAVKKRIFDSELFNNFKILLKNPIVTLNATLRKLVRGNRGKWYKNFHGYRLNMMSEQAPDPESRVMPGNATDKFGQKKIELKWKLNRTDIKKYSKISGNTGSGTSK